MRLYTENALWRSGVLSSECKPNNCLGAARSLKRVRRIPTVACVTAAIARSALSMRFSCINYLFFPVLPLLWFSGAKRSLGQRKHGIIARSRHLIVGMGGSMVYRLQRAFS